MKTKKLLAITLSAIAALTITSGCSGSDQPGQSSFNGNILTPGLQSGYNSVAPTGIDATLKLTSGGWNNLQWQNYEHQYATLQVPVGWKVEVTDLYQGGATGSGTMVSIKSPDESVMLAYIDFYSVPQMMMKSPTVESFLTDVVVPANNGKIQNFVVTGTNQTDQHKALYDNAALGTYDAKIVSADYNFNGKPYEGFYSAAITGKDMASTGLYMVVSVVSVDTPKGEMQNWEPVVVKILGSIQWTSACISRYGGTTVGSAGSAGSGSTSDMIMDSWNKRNQSEDIMSQKRSDATLGQERVVDNYTGDIYKADNGFYDQYSSMGGTRYSPISDDQYTQGYSGYIGF